MPKAEPPEPKYAPGDVVQRDGFPAIVIQVYPNPAPHPETPGPDFRYDILQTYPGRHPRWPVGVPESVLSDP